MTDQVRMKSKTVFSNERITVFREGGPEEGIKGGAALVGDEFETDLGHAKELAALDIAEPLKAADLKVETPALQPHHQVSVPQLAADQATRAQADSAASASVATSKAKAKPAR